MYWLQRPPILRYVLATLVLLVAAWIELRPAPLVERPFARVEIAAGTQLDAALIEWREVPAARLPDVDVGGRAAVAIPAGTPIVAALISHSAIQAPDGWWTMQLDGIPAGLPPGTDLQLVVVPGPGDDPVPAIPAVVIEAPALGGSTFGQDRPGTVAVPPESAARAAIAAAAGRISVLAASVRSHEEEHDGV